MKLAILFAAILSISGLCGFAWAIGLDAALLAELPWWEIALLSFPVIGIALHRLTAGE